MLQKDVNSRLSDFRVLGFLCLKGVWGFRLRASDVGFRGQAVRASAARGLGFKVQGLGFRVLRSQQV